MVKRLYVHEEIYDEFGEKLMAFVGSLKYDKDKNLFESLSKEGLTPALCGNIQDSAGYFIHPTIVDNPPESSRVVQEERFAPILPMLRWSDEDNVIARANDTEMGLGRRYGAVI
ncbi:hypothetical protein IFM46972_04782 [Aspergillus udagawae]|uniref:aldehyde dehydrogenase (NAD(+)) n=1 Tax=Aspergillus udagawae TaxID=91492 RepID=A0A8H3RSB2_9EURO|nr:hypothetical protein IFM46972_04782 [Aspergillus udagawae]